MIKRIFLGLLGLIVVGAGAAWFVMRDIGPTHPGLANSDLPPLIPTYATYANPRSASGYVPSSDGRYVWFEKASLRGRATAVRDMQTGDIIAEFPANVNHRRWHPTEPRVRFIYQGHDWEADIFNPEQENWIRTSPAALSGGWVKNSVARSPDEKILMWGKTSNRSTANLYLVSQDGLEVDKIADGTDDTYFWIMDKHQTPRVRVDSLDEATVRFSRTDDDGETWTKLVDMDVTDTFEVQSKIRDDGTFLARSSRGRDKVALVAFNIEDARETVVLENPNSDIGYMTTLTHDGFPDVYRMGPMTNERVALTERGEVFLDIISDYEEPYSLGFTSPSADGRYVAVALSPAEQSWVYLLIDFETKTHTKINEYNFRRFKDRLALGAPVTVPARDGLELPAVMYRPKGAEGLVPFIVMIHGGPQGHEGLSYRHQAQFLTNRGYGLLYLNFRGSDGFGKEFQSKGFLEYGRAMQDDITDAANWLVDEGLADPEGLVAMGGSYGGYAAAMAMTRDPGLFDAAVVMYPMLDVEFQTKHYPGFWNGGLARWWNYFGKLDDEAQRADMKTFSPVNRADQVHGPIMVIYGAQDQVTAPQQVRDFSDAMEKAGKPLIVHSLPNAAHGANHWRDRFQEARYIEDFLADTVGGRSGGFDPVEWAPEFID